VSTQVIAVVNMKGGVGKSATVVSLADALGAKKVGGVLVMDVDTQATASFFLAGDQILKDLITSGKTIDQFLIRALVDHDANISLVDFIRPQVSNTRHLRKPLDVSLIASSTTLRASEREIVRHLTAAGVNLVAIEQRIGGILQEQIAAMNGRYRYIIVDCAPGISPFTTAAIGLADLVLVPTIPDAPSFLGLAAFLAHIHREMTHCNAQRPPHVLLTRYAPRSIMAWLPGTRRRGRINHQEDYRRRISALAKSGDPEFKVLNTMVMETTLMPHAMSLGTGDPQAAPTFAQKYPGELGQLLDKLADEIMEALK
jgi:cellulose biosynthesis protein BcsQ